MSLLIKGTTNFLGLTDTPAAYAGEAGKAAVVNAGEDALEFATIEAAESTHYPRNVLFNGVAPVAWTDLDLGVGQCMALIRVNCADAALRRWFFRQNGETLNIANTFVIDSCVTNQPAGTQIGYVWVATDADGKIEWYGSAAVAVDLTLECYVLGCTWPGNEIFNGVVTNAWQELDLGVGRVLALLRVVFANNNDNLRTRRYGDTGITDPSRHHGMSTAMTNGAGQVGYCLAPTNGEGKIEMYSDAASNKVITLVGYIKGLYYPEMEIHNGAGPVAWANLAFGIGKCLAIMFQMGTLVMGCEFNTRLDGEAQSPVASENGIASVGDQFGYCLMVTSYAGIYEWECAQNDVRQVLSIGYTNM